MRYSAFAFLSATSLPLWPAEEPRRGELAELVPDHVLVHVHRDELVAVVHGERVADELGRDRATPAHHVLTTFFSLPSVQRLHLAPAGRPDERSLLDARDIAVRALLGRPAALRPRTMNWFDGFLRFRVFLPFVCLPHGRHRAGVRREDLPSPPPVRMVHRVHHHAARPAGGLPSQRFVPALPIDDQSRARRCPPRRSWRRQSAVDHPHLARGQAQRDVLAFLRHELDAGAGAAGHLRRPCRGLSSMLCTNVPSGISASGSALPSRDVGTRPASRSSPTFSPFGCEDVALLAVGVLHQRDARASGSDRTRSSRPCAGMPTLFALEVDDAVHPLVPAAAVPRRDAAGVVAPARLLRAARSATSPACSRVISSKPETERNRVPASPA